MATLQFSSQLNNDFLLLPGAFVDNYMQNANGEYVKVYLYLVRTLSTGRELSLEKMAEDLDHTQRDIVRALYYWDEEQLIRLGFNSKQEVTNIVLLPIDTPTTNVNSSVPKEKETTIKESSIQLQHQQEAAVSVDVSSETDFQAERKTETSTETKMPSYNGFQSSYTDNSRQVVASIEDLSQDDAFSELCFLAQTYTQKTLTPRDTERIGYWYILYDCSFDIIEYLLEYCVEIGHPNINYMEKVILNWHGSGLRTVDEIKEYSRTYNKINFQVMRALGLGDRSPGAKELQYIKKWTQTFGFDLEMIEIACERTLSAIQKPSFNYVDSILTAWDKNGCRTKADLEIYDANYQRNKQKESQTTVNSNIQNLQNQNKQQQSKPNKFHNFEQRTNDYNKLVADYYGYQD